MPKRSIREDKSIYQESRERAGLTRDAASEQIGWLSASRIERIESGKCVPKSDEVLAMAACYHDALLCNHYCIQECQIGQRTMPALEIKSLSQITLELLATLNLLNERKDRLIEITVDGVVSDDEKADFRQIEENLNSMAATIESLKLWLATVENGGE